MKTFCSTFALCCCVLALHTAANAAEWRDIIVDTDAAGGIGATRFGGGVAVAYARPASNEVVVATLGATGAIARTVLGSTVAARNVELCAASADDADLFCVWDDSAGNLFWARKGDGWAVRTVEQEQNVSNSFALQLHRIRYSFASPMPPFNTITVELTVPIIYYRNEVAQQLERVYVSGYNPGGGTFTWTRETIPSGTNSGKGCDSSSFANDLYHHIVTHCADTQDKDILTARLEDGWTNFTVCSEANVNSLPPTSFEQGVDAMPRMAFYWCHTVLFPFIVVNSGPIYFDSSQAAYNVIEMSGGTGNGTAPALKLNHQGRPLAAYYWHSAGTVHCATRGGRLGGYLWNAETCGTGRWDGTSASIDIASGISNTYVFYVNDVDDTLHLSSSDFVPPDKSIVGIVTNALTGEPISNVVLTASETSDWTWVATTTDTSGSYAFTFIPTGTYTVVCAASNYVALTTNVTLTAANSPYNLAIGLTPTAPPEPPIPYAGWAVGGPMDGYCSIVATRDSGATWVRQGSGQVAAVMLAGIHAVDSLTAWVVGAATDGYATIYHTSDGGATWTRKGVGQAALANKELFKVHASDTRVFAVGQDAVIRSDDGGATWTNCLPAAYTNTHFQAVFSVDGTAVWVGGDGTNGTVHATLLHSTDGGDSWVQQVMTQANHILGVSAANTGTAWAVGGDGFVVCRTDDGGASWIKQPASGGLGDANEVCAVNTQVVYVAVDNFIEWTTNGGASWDSFGAIFYVMGVDAVDEQNAWAVSTGAMLSTGAIFHTSNGGAAWEAQSVTNSGTPKLSDVSFARTPVPEPAAAALIVVCCLFGVRKRS